MKKQGKTPFPLTPNPSPPRGEGRLEEQTLRADVCIFDISKGNPNVAFELGLAAAVGKSCIILLKTGEHNSLGAADLGYSERVEYTSRESLKAKLKQLLSAKSSALRLFNDISYEMQRSSFNITQKQDEQHLTEIVKHVFLYKKITKPKARSIFGDDKRATVALNALRNANVLRVEGSTKGAAWVFTDRPERIRGYLVSCRRAVWHGC